MFILGPFGLSMQVESKIHKPFIPLIVAPTLFVQDMPCPQRGDRRVKRIDAWAELRFFSCITLISDPKLFSGRNLFRTYEPQSTLRILPVEPRGLD